VKKIEIKTTITEYSSPEELSHEYQNLILEAKNATHFAYAPYSEFHVGAAVLLEKGEIITGSNQENSAYPSGLCAERVALFYANSKYPDQKVMAIAIAASQNDQYSKNPITPCGSCRQVLLETETRFDKAIKVFLIGECRIVEIDNVHDLLPISFDGEFLRNK